MNPEALARMADYSTAARDAIVRYLLSDVHSLVIEDQSYEDARVLFEALQALEGIDGEIKRAKGESDSTEPAS